jgi:hypothetical protein
LLRRWRVVFLCWWFFNKWLLQVKIWSRKKEEGGGHTLMSLVRKLRRKEEYNLLGWKKYAVYFPTRWR